MLNVWVINYTCDLLLNKWNCLINNLCEQPYSIHYSNSKVTIYIKRCMKNGHNKKWEEQIKNNDCSTNMWALVYVL